MVPRKPQPRRPGQRRDLQIEAFARDLLAEGLPSEAAEVLSLLAQNIARHEPSTLPCLCSFCGFQGFEAHAGGETFVRDFVVIARRYFPYWVPASTARGRGLERLRRSMRVALHVSTHRTTPGAQPLPNDVASKLRAWENASGSNNEEIPF
jgi:hypothetical protein